MFGITFAISTLAIGAVPYVLATALATWLFLDGKDNPFRSDRKMAAIVEQVVITIVGIALMFLALLIAGGLAEGSGGLLGLFAIPICVGVIASGYAIVGMMLYEMEFGTGFGFGATILTLHVLTTWGIIKLPGILLGIL